MKAVVFDMDGVLFDTERLCMEAWSIVAKKMGISGMDVIAGQCIGLNSQDTKELVLAHYGQNFDYELFRGRVSEWVHGEIGKKGLPVKMGVKKILPYLQQTGYRIGLASSSSYASVVSHLKEAEVIDYFQVIITGDMIEHSKPRPDIYLLACKKLGVKPELAYAIEDSPNGIRAAHSAGMKPIMVPDLVEPDSEMKELAILICENLHEVIKYINQQGANIASPPMG